MKLRILNPRNNESFDPEVEIVKKFIEDNKKENRIVSFLKQLRPTKPRQQFFIGSNFEIE